MSKGKKQKAIDHLVEENTRYRAEIRASDGALRHYKARIDTLVEVNDTQASRIDMLLNRQQQARRFLADPPKFEGRQYADEEWVREYPEHEDDDADHR